MPSSVSTIEIFPDEVFLEVCRYLHVADVLYSFFHLTARLDRTISFYRQHVSLHRTSYVQFLEIFTQILPQMTDSIRSLVIFELESPLFFASFQHSEIYPNLEKLTLVNWTDKKLIPFIDTLHGMNSFRTLMIQALDLTESTDHGELLEKILAANHSRLNRIVFDHECDSFELPTSLTPPMTFDNVTELSIALGTTNDLFQLVEMIPCVERLHTTLKGPWEQTGLPPGEFSRLKELSVYAMSWLSTFQNLKSLVQIAPALETVSLVLVTHDCALIDGDKVLSLFPPTLQQCSYSICYQPHPVDIELDVIPILRSWRSIPIAYAISESDKRVFLHTIPYQATRLSLRSLFHRHVSADVNSHLYRSVRHLHVYDTLALAETFGIARHSRSIVDLVISIRTLPSSKASTLTLPDLVPTLPHLGNHEVPKVPAILPQLSRLDFLSIQGLPSDLNYLEKILLSAPNLSTFSIDFDCLFQLVSDENQALAVFPLLHRLIVILCLRFENTTITQLTSDHIHCLARVFSRVNHMCMDLRNSNLSIESQMIASLLNEFPSLVVLSLYGTLSKETDFNVHALKQYLAEQSPGRCRHKETFTIDFGHERVKVWM